MLKEQIIKYGIWSPIEGVKFKIKGKSDSDYKNCHSSRGSISGRLVFLRGDSYSEVYHTEDSSIIGDSDRESFSSDVRSAYDVCGESIGINGTSCRVPNGNRDRQ